jgi:hydrogenase-4 component B
MFLGNPRTHLHQQPREVSLSMRLPQYFILIIMLSIGLFPQFYFSIVNEIVLRFIPAASAASNLIPSSLINSISSIGKFSMLFILLLILIFLVRNSFSRKRTVAKGLTWGCGYAVPTARMQYTGKSFSKSIGKLLNFIILEKKKYKEISAGEIFPAKRKHSSHYNDFFVTRIFNGIVDRLLYSMNYFQFIQNGKIQMYILYGIFFIVVVFLGTLFKFI